MVVEPLLLAFAVMDAPSSQSLCITHSPPLLHPLPRCHYPNQYTCFSVTTFCCVFTLLSSSSQSIPSYDWWPPFLFVSRCFKPHSVMFQGEAREHIRALYVAYRPQALHFPVPNFSPNAPRVTAAFFNSVFFLPLGFAFSGGTRLVNVVTSFRHKIRFVYRLENKFQSKNKCTHQLVPNVS